MKSWLGPSLFRRYLAMTLVVMCGIVFSLLAYFLALAPKPEWVEPDMLLFVRALDSIADDVNVETARINAKKVALLNLESASVRPEPDELEYAIYRDGKLFLQSGSAPLALLAESSADPERRVIRKDGWYVRGFKREASSTVSVLAVRERYVRRLVRSDVISGLSFAILVYAVFALLVAAVGSYFALRPMVDLTRRIRALDTAQFEALRINTPFRELMPVVAALNERTNALKAQWDAERTFFSNAAHELRTPLAVINAQAHGVTTASSDEERKQRVEELQNGVDRAARALGRMLQLARLDAAGPVSNAQLINLGELAADCVAFHAPRAFANNQSISLQENAVAWTRADRIEVVTMIENVLENAINYAGCSATIVVAVGTANDGHVYVSVTDNGPGFSATDFAAAFERFHRGSQAVSHAGSGLGLAIVKAAAHRAGGHVTADNVAVGTGLCVKISLPASMAA